MRLSTVCLSSCCGCHMALVNLGDALLDILGSNDLVFSPVLMDIKHPQPCDIALVEGGVRNDENIEVLQELRKNTKTLVAYGTCACFGGVPGLGSGFSNNALLEEAYPSSFNREGIPELTARVAPIDAYVTVDAYLPGCAPPSGILKDTLVRLVSGQAPQRHDLPICAECPRSASKGAPRELKRTIDSIPAPDVCLLTQGYVCMGSVSRAGCGAPCTSAGVPCLGCRGPTDRILTDKSHGIIHDIVRRISHFTGLKEEAIEKQVEDQLHCLYAYTLSVPEMRMASRENISKLIHRIPV